MLWDAVQFLPMVTLQNFICLKEEQDIGSHGPASHQQHLPEAPMPSQEEARRNLHLDCFMETSCSCLLGPSVVASSAHVCVRRVRDWRRSSRTAIPATYLMCCCKSKPCCFGLPDLQLHGIVQPSASHTVG